MDVSQYIEGSYLFYLDEDHFRPIIPENSLKLSEIEITPDLIGLKKGEIMNFFSETFNLKITPEDVFVLSFSAARVSEITEEQALQILNDPKVKSAQNDFTIQNIRPKMQGEGPVEQNIRPKMQEEWQYDSIKHSSTNVEFVNPEGKVGNTTNKIWIVDTGVDGNHQDLNVITDPEYSKSFVDTETNPLMDILGHGTHCAGIAAGLAHHQSDPNVLGMNGVSPGAPIVSVKVINWYGEGVWSKVLDAMEHVILKSSPGDIISMSFGDKLPGNANPNKCLPMPTSSTNNKRYLLNQIEILASNGVYVVMASGNTGESSEGFFPGCFDFNDMVMTVGSIKTTYDFTTGDYNSSFSVFSSRGIPSIDFVAPGEFMFSTFPHNLYAVLSGTSMSTAMVAGIIHANGDFRMILIKLLGLHPATPIRLLKRNNQ
ncbi:S8 family serine peptidase [Algoriphagus halophilus]|uniref:S8 family peptidase n=1 Tax=Algoriphagus halophilus TaxID=226505 RepID=UPI00358F6055